MMKPIVGEQNPEFSVQIEMKDELFRQELLQRVSVGTN